MKTILLGCAAVSLLSASAFGADLAVPPLAPVAHPFSWTSCYGGAHVGGSTSRRDITDPVQLAQDSVLGPGTTVGVTTVNLNSTGFLAGAQIAWDRFSGPGRVGLQSMYLHQTVDIQNVMPSGRFE